MCDGSSISLFKSEVDFMYKFTAKKNKNNKIDNGIKNYSFRLFFIFLGLAVCVTVFVSVLLLKKTGETVQSKVSSLVRITTYQQMLNVDTYMDKIKTITSMLFSDELYYNYDATTDELDDFEKIQIEQQILNRIQDLGILSNFSDFGIVYADDHTVGWISDTTYKMYPNGGMYKAFSNNITDKKTDSGWFTIFQKNYSRIYYVKRLNANALLVSSFYSHEIEDVFELSSDMKDAVVRLVNEDSLVICSTDKNEIGMKLDDDILDLIDGRDDIYVQGKGYFLTTNQCRTNSWSVVCTVPSDTVLGDIRSLRIFTYATSALMVIIVLVFGLFVIHKFSETINEAFSSLKHRADYDQLTGLLNKASFQSMTEVFVNTAIKGAVDVFVMMDMDFFKSINDRYGHDVGDKVLVRFSKIVRRLFSSDVLTGRVGGDEFALYMKLNNTSKDDAEKRLTDEISVLLAEFMTEFKEENENCRLSLSVGIAVAESGALSFDEIYKAADTALYISKNNGKNQYTFSGMT